MHVPRESRVRICHWIDDCGFITRPIPEPASLALAALVAVAARRTVRAAHPSPLHAPD